MGAENTAGSKGARGRGSDPHSPLAEMTMLTVYAPCERVPQSLQYEDIIAACPAVARIVAQIQKSPLLGRVGRYGGVFELSFGYEGFTPLEGSNPRQGKTGASETVPAIALRAFARCAPDDARLVREIDAICAVHPWEHPALLLASVWVLDPDRGERAGEHAS